MLVAKFSSGGLLIKWAPLYTRDPKRVNTIKRLLTLQVKVGPPGNEFLKPYELFQHVVIDNVPYVVFPRAVVALLTTPPSLIDNIEVVPSLPTPRAPTLELKYQLNPNQEITQRAIMKTFAPWLNNVREVPCSAVFLRLKPGFGKTVLALDLIREFLASGRSLYVVPRVELAKQVRADAERFLIGLRVGIRGGGEIDSLLPAPTDVKVKKKTRYDCHLLIVVINSMVKLPAEEVSQGRLIILDECHEYCTPTFMGAFAPPHYDVAPPALLAMSGTPMDSKLSAMLPWFVAPLLDAHELEGFHTDLVSFTTRIQPILYKGPPAYTETLRREIRIGRDTLEPVAPDKMLKQILADPWRFQLLIQKLDQLLAANHCVFIFADQRKFLQNLLGFLRKRNTAVECPELASEEVPQKQVGLLIGQERADNIARAKKEAQVILATYKYGSTGISLARMTAIILATPRKAKTDQTIARILRLDSDASIHRLVYDFVDESTPLKHQFGNRKDGRTLTYQAEGMAILPPVVVSMSALPTPTLATIVDGPKFVVLVEGTPTGALEDKLVSLESNEHTMLMASAPSPLTTLGEKRGWLVIAPTSHEAKTPDILLWYGKDQKKAARAASKLDCALVFEKVSD